MLFDQWTNYLIFLLGVIPFLLLLVVFVWSLFTVYKLEVKIDKLEVKAADAVKAFKGLRRLK